MNKDLKLIQKTNLKMEKYLTAINNKHLIMLNALKLSNADDHKDYKIKYKIANNNVQNADDELNKCYKSIRLLYKNEEQSFNIFDQTD